MHWPRLALCVSLHLARIRSDPLRALPFSRVAQDVFRATETLDIDHHVSGKQVPLITQARARSLSVASARPCCSALTALWSNSACDEEGCRAF
eukprot:6197726-Pleurochrysis_carterae.AAC.1